MLSHRISSLQLSIKKFAETESLEDLCKEIVGCSVQDLEFDRCSLFLHDKETHTKVGTWGTDPHGNIEDQRDTRAPIHDLEVSSPTEGELGLIINEDQLLHHQEKEIERGTLIQCGIFDAGELLGWLFIDNFINQQPFDTEEIHFIHMYSSVVGQLIVKQRQHEKLTDQCAQIDSTLHKLKQTQKDLIEEQKMAALGRLIAGVSHELNTPIGVSLTAITHLKHLLLNLKRHVKDDALTKQDFDEYLANAQEALDLSHRNINKSGNLIKHFKGLATNQEVDQLIEINLEQLLKDKCETYLHSKPDTHVDIEITIQPQVAQWTIYFNSFSQIINELLKNTLTHGFANRAEGLIKISASEIYKSNQRHLELQFEDNGKGMTSKELTILFEPFYTGNVQTGPGLGTSIVFNIVNGKLNGKIDALHSQSGGLLLKILIPES